ncbi:hypothetical protein Q427_15795 [Halomonas sp. BC04]|nr:hypothetical protein Q427_15795 [Halomonas sp. BC04]
MAVAGWPIDGDSTLLQALAQGIDIIDPVGEMAEVASTGVCLGVPVPGQFQLGSLEFRRARLVLRCCEEYQGEAPLLVLLAAHLLQAEQIAVEAQRLIQVADAHHGVQKLHKPSLSFISSGEQPGNR